MPWLAHIVRAVYISDNPQVCVFTAYFDASGDKRSKVISIGGFVAEASRWDAFQNEWKALLPPGLDMFHMSDFASSKEGWESWKGKSSKRAWFIEQLVTCIQRHTRKGFLASMALDDYLAINAEFQLGERAESVYQLISVAAVSYLRKWSDKKSIDHRKILCIFEEGDEDQGSFIRNIQAEGYNAITQPKKNIRAFDACDFIAWRGKQLHDDALIKGLHVTPGVAADRLRASLRQLDRIVGRSAHGTLSQSSMRRICEALGLPKRDPGTILKP